MNKKCQNYGGHFDPDKKTQKIKELESIISSPNFWNQSNTGDTIAELNELKKNFNQVQDLKNKIQNNLEMLLLLKESPDKDLFEVLLSETKEIENLIEEISLILLLKILLNRIRGRLISK